MKTYFSLNFEIMKKKVPTKKQHNETNSEIISPENSPNKKTIISDMSPLDQPTQGLTDITKVFDHLFLPSIGKIAKLSLNPTNYSTSDQDLGLISSQIPIDELLLLLQSKTRNFSKALSIFRSAEDRLALCLKLIASAFEISLPFIIRALLSWYNSKDASLAAGICLSLLLSLTVLLKGISYQLGCYFAARSAARIANAICGAVYHKISNLSVLSIRKIGSGQFVQLSVLEARVTACYSQYFHFLYQVPALAIIITALLILEFGYLGLILPFSFITGLFLQQWISGVRKAYSQKFYESISIRNNFQEEVLRGIKAVKFNCWEGKVLKKLGLMKKKENEFLSSSCLMSNINNFLPDFFFPIFLIAKVWIFGLFANQTLNLSHFILALTLGNLFFGSLKLWPGAINFFYMNKFFNSKIDKIFELEELEQNKDLNQVDYENESEEELIEKEKGKIKKFKNLIKGEILFENYEGKYFKNQEFNTEYINTYSNLLKEEKKKI